jgi:hypothetical protein
MADGHIQTNVPNAVTEGAVGIAYRGILIGDLKFSA